MTRVTLIHNPSAGSESSQGEELMTRLRNVGYEVVYRTTDDIAAALSEPSDLVAVAGGDGTVATVATLLAGRDLPMAIIPAGTSNNIAWSLGIRGSVEETIVRLPDANHARLDVAIARAPWGESRFVESAGVGFFAAMLRDARATADHEPPADDATDERSARIERGVARVRRVLARTRPRDCVVVGDGEDLSGQYLLVAAMNIRRIGTCLELAPSADAGDGRFDLVLVRDEDRAALDAYLEEALAGAEPCFPIATRQVARIEIEWGRTDGHLDDTPWPEADGAGARVELSIAEPAVHILAATYATSS